VPGAFVLIDTVLGGILSGGIAAGTNAAAMFGGVVGFATFLPAILSGPMAPFVAAVLLLNSLFGSWQSQLQAWAAQNLAYDLANPIHSAIIRVQAIIDNLNAELEAVGGSLRAVVQAKIDSYQNLLDALTVASRISLSPAQQTAFIQWANSKYV
jgi:hypothetical protein